jgi:CBS domain-containing protein
MWTAWDRLRGTRTQHLVVLDDHERPVGVLDERTIALGWPPAPMGAHRTPVHTLLRGRARPRVRSADDVGAVARTMLGARAEAVPVVDRDGRLLGLITLWHFAELATRGGRDEPSRGSLARSTGAR